MTEEFIDLIRTHPVLYDPSCKEYKNLALRNAAWQSIAETLNESVEKCREDWTKLRNAYASVLKRRRKKKGQGVVIPWRLEESMSFLLPHMECRDGETNVQDLKTLVIPQKRFKISDEQKPNREASLLHEMDKTDLFFLAMSKALKALPKIEQTKIKLDLHTAISEAEIRQIEQENQNYVIINESPDIKLTK